MYQNYIKRLKKSEMKGILNSSILESLVNYYNSTKIRDNILRQSKVHIIWDEEKKWLTQKTEIFNYHLLRFNSAARVFHPPFSSPWSRQQRAELKLKEQMNLIRLELVPLGMEFQVVKSKLDLWWKKIKIWQSIKMETNIFRFFWP